MAEKTEKPTDKRRQKSAKKGQVFKSKDLISTGILLSGIYFLSDVVRFQDFMELYTFLLVNGSDINLKDFMTSLMHVFLKMALPFIVLCCASGYATTLLQTRFSLATEAIKLNFKALNPVQGFKKIFSMRTAKELVKSIFYLFVFICTCYLFIKDDVGHILTIYHLTIPQLINVWVALVVKAVLIFIACALIVLLADFLAEYFLHFKELKMDKHEVKQERKENDGNPEIKSARRRTHQEILSGENKAAIRNSSVVIANPTHIAVAIYFNPEMASLPFIALRASNMKALAAIAYAEKIGVPVVRYIPLARKLYRNYRQYSFISLNDDLLLDVMDVLIWLRQVETAGIELPQQEVKEDNSGKTPSD
ncbi:EscU/YscU/HrcU family type III secretion system export apparatus switch protein [Erwinia psidii]|uniref:EscU/YscU/HrcU family type III secretion system export apparatus switch protein n=1 Tax=Erwinia psidii TaxID=69224 RepID=A0A3N6S296_9GAMM|nr:EscU/YscU/HrcU family type III secretion system export apparatus switch protein [Erwinia psidii]MCX8958708.1 EscU/YscU/HrcU family type III secretion system export apparatus switch protein [Erwinia psidii]MCX8961162.1 EscU/YscU/HrcU family type III secretion system export apparatus switch protein [Erwinia psidii]MCX8966666.1 EscU/YscU/HrcU family type III secretion system export apparatus switch protein [Erwinia psidii]RQM38957.1 EscU/YscU/HrcU family type III secretion system export apparat